MIRVTAALWTAAAVAIALVLVWRLRRATHTLDTILREERDRDPDPLDVDDETHEVGHRRQDG